jgi:hypothetical protein
VTVSETAAAHPVIGVAAGSVAGLRRQLHGSAATSCSGRRSWSREVRRGEQTVLRGLKRAVAPPGPNTGLRWHRKLIAIRFDHREGIPTYAARQSDLFFLEHDQLGSRLVMTCWTEPASPIARLPVRPSRPKSRPVSVSGTIVAFSS